MNMTKIIKIFLYFCICIDCNNYKKKKINNNNNKKKNSIQILFYNYIVKVLIQSKVLISTR